MRAFVLLVVLIPPVLARAIDCPPPGGPPCSGVPSGVSLLKLKAGPAGKASIVVKGKGPFLGLPPLASVSPPVRVQLQADGAGCWEATFTPITLDSAYSVLKARGD